MWITEIISVVQEKLPYWHFFLVREMVRYCYILNKWNFSYSAYTGKGLLKINGRIINGKILRSNSSFMQQKDVFVESLTVFEHMNFMVNLLY